MTRIAAAHLADRQVLTPASKQAIAPFLTPGNFTNPDCRSINGAAIVWDDGTVAVLTSEWARYDIPVDMLLDIE